MLRATLYSLALSQSHKATFAILKSIREKVLEKLPKMPLGTILDTSSGQMKQVIVDQVESMERPLAHLLPEMTANVLGPVCILIYLFVLDWRMALLSLVSIPVGMAFMMASWPATASSTRLGQNHPSHEQRHCGVHRRH